MPFKLPAREGNYDEEMGENILAQVKKMYPDFLTGKGNPAGVTTDSDRSGSHSPAVSMPVEAGNKKVKMKQYPESGGTRSFIAGMGQCLFLFTPSTG